MFYVGQKVVCINDSGFKCYYGEKRPKKGIVYTVRGLKNSGGILLKEIVNEPNFYRDNTGKIVFVEKGWLPFRFAPLEEYTDSMSIAMQLVQELDQVDKAKNPVKTPQTA